MASTSAAPFSASGQRPQNFPLQQLQDGPPLPPLQQQETRRSRASSGGGRRTRTFSFGSQKSDNSSKKADLTETHAEKEAKRLHSKADPTLAMQEAEPSVVAANAKSVLPGLRNFQHKDAWGNPISEPDLSNPTRSRWERPLDTIRSFEAAIDGGYNRKSIMRSDTESVDWNRRSSYFAGNGRAQGSYYGSRPQSMFRPESQYDARQSVAWQQQPRDSYFDPQAGNGNNNGYNNNGPPPVPQHGGRRYPRNGSEPHINTQKPDPNVYPIPNNTRSYETVASASGSGSYGEPHGYQTDPTSSDNSSIERERRQSPAKREPQNDYGIGFAQNSYQPSAFTVGDSGAPNGRPMNNVPAAANGGENYPAPPPVPQKGGTGTALRKPTSNTTANAPQQRPEPLEKRKSWFGRRFSKNSG